MRWGATDEWSKWFAWRPVSTLDGNWVWFEYVMRRKGYVTNSYRVIDKESHHD